MPGDVYGTVESPLGNTKFPHEKAVSKFIHVNVFQQLLCAQKIIAVAPRCSTCPWGSSHLCSAEHTQFNGALRCSTNLHYSCRAALGNNQYSMQGSGTAQLFFYADDSRNIGQCYENTRIAFYRVNSGEIGAYMCRPLGVRAGGMVIQQL